MTKTTMTNEAAASARAERLRLADQNLLAALAPRHMRYYVSAFERPRPCVHCKLVAARPDSLYCSPACKASFLNFEEVE